MTNALRGVGVVAALGVMAMAGWHVMHAPAPDAHLRPLAAGGRVAGIDRWPLFADADGDGTGEIVFWRSGSGTLVALDAESGEYVWESAAVSGGSVGGRAWATREGLFVSGSDGSFSALDAKDGQQRFRRELGEKTAALCRARDGLWVTLESGRTLGLDALSGSALGERAAPEGAARLNDCEPIWGDRMPDRGAARIAEPSDWAQLLADRSSPLGPQPLAELSPSVSAYLHTGAEPSWVLYGTRDDGTRAPLLARTGTRAAPFAAAWSQPAAAGHAAAAVQQGPFLAVTATAAYVAFFFEAERHATVARFDLQNGQRRWQVQLAPDSLASIAASDRHVVVTWAGGSLRDGARPDFFGLIVLNAETGEKISQVGRGSYRH